MKILIPTWIYPPDIGWPASYVPKISARILQDEITPIVITYSNVAEDARYDSLGYSVIRIRRKTFFVWNYIRFFFSVLKNGYWCDLIYLQDYFSAGIPTILANLFLRKKLVTKVVWIFSWEQAMNRWMIYETLDDYICKRQSTILEGIKKVEKFLLNQSKTIIVPSNYMKNVLIRFWVHAEKIQVVYNSFDPIEENNPTRIISSPKEKSKLVYLSVGRLVEWKNFERLIENFTSINGILYIAWDGPLRDVLIQKIQDTKQEWKVFLLWSLSKKNLYEYYKNIDIFILISSYEGMSHTLIEAMSMNLPIITSNIEANIETLEWYNRKKIIDISDTGPLDLTPGGAMGENTDFDHMQRFNFEKLYLQLRYILIGR